MKCEKCNSVVSTNQATCPSCGAAGSTHFQRDPNLRKGVAALITIWAVLGPVFLGLAMFGMTVAPFTTSVSAIITLIGGLLAYVVFKWGTRTTFA